jgi:cytochrome c oxidase assembly factor 3, animal type
MKQTLIRRMLITNIKRVGNNNLEQVATTTGGGEKFLRKIDLAKDMAKLSPDQKIYIEKLVKKNEERFELQKKLKKHYNITGFILFSIVISIYLYTIFSIKQEKFLEDFDIPEPPDPAVKNFKK